MSENKEEISDIDAQWKEEIGTLFKSEKQFKKFDKAMREFLEAYNRLIRCFGNLDDFKGPKERDTLWRSIYMAIQTKLLNTFIDDKVASKIMDYLERTLIERKSSEDNSMYL